MQKALILLCLLAVSALAMPVNIAELKSLWSSWKTYHRRAYATAEEAARFAIFVENYKKVINFNAANEDVKLALNKFSDLTAQEFKSIYASGYKKNVAARKNIQVATYEHVAIPDSFDWRTKGAVTPVKDQGQCGSCWSFSTTGALEGFYFNNNNKLVSLSEQQIVDCDTNDGGCDGGDQATALQYTASSGVETEDTYPYTAADGKCAYKKLKALDVNKGYKSVQTKSAEALKGAITTQTVAVSIEADEDVFQQYSSGVIKKSCSDDLDHAVLAVGYGTFNGDDAFIVKNSWGADWGQEGYVYLGTSEKVNNGNGVCGILAEPVVPTN